MLGLCSLLVIVCFTSVSLEQAFRPSASLSSCPPHTQSSSQRSCLRLARLPPTCFPPLRPQPPPRCPPRCPPPHPHPRWPSGHLWTASAHARRRGRRLAAARPPPTTTGASCTSIAVRACSRLRAQHVHVMMEKWSCWPVEERHSLHRAVFWMHVTLAEFYTRPEFEVRAFCDFKTRVSLFNVQQVILLPLALCDHPPGLS